MTYLEIRGYSLAPARVVSPDGQIQVRRFPRVRWSLHAPAAVTRYEHPRIINAHFRDVPGPISSIRIFDPSRDTWCILEPEDFDVELRGDWVEVRVNRALARV